jgi:hypothetical protein
MKKIVDLRRNTDGTITAVYGTDRVSFTVEKWMTEDEILDRAKWELILLGVPIDYVEEDE